MAASPLSVVVVKHGTRETTRSDVYLNYRQYGEPDGPHTVDYYLWAVLGGERPIVIDTGFAPGPARRRGRIVLVDPVDACRAIGIDPDEPLDLVVTHAHYDHIGNLDRFPAATIHVAAAEVEFWRSPRSRKHLIDHFTEAHELDALIAAVQTGRARTFSGSHVLAPGVELIEVGGHTPGQTMVSVETDTGTVLLASDAAHFREEIDRDMPFISVTDLPATYDGLAAIREMVADGSVAIVVPGHDADVLSTTTPLDVPADHILRDLAGRLGGPS